jgi:tRNA pseudouridine55 synthase
MLKEEQFSSSDIILIHGSQRFDFQKGEVMVFDKPLDWTSFDLVQKVRNSICRKLKIKKLKVGHAGTLDPKATGVLILCTGKATGQIETYQAEEKEYIATLKIGATTPTFDLESEEDQEYEISHITREKIEEALKKFTGTIQQVPPVFSAVQVDGKRAYNLARKGVAVELKAKELLIREIELLEFSGLEMKIRIVCSKGTYIRALARDIGKALESGAYLIGLRRTRVGNIRVEQALDIQQWLNSTHEACFVANGSNSIQN